MTKGLQVFTFSQENHEHHKGKCRYKNRNSERHSGIIRSVQTENFPCTSGVKKGFHRNRFSERLHRNKMDDRSTKIILACILINSFKWKTIPTVKKDDIVNEFCKRYLIQVLLTSSNHMNWNGTVT